LSTLLEITGVSKEYTLRRGLRPGSRQVLHAVQDVDLTVASGTTLAVVGESGCGKSTLGRMALGLTRPTSGSVRLKGQNFGAARGRQARELRRQAQAVFQDPDSSLDPRRTVGQAVAEPLAAIGVSAAQRRTQVAELLGQVGLDPAMAGRMPRLLSGGQKQRVVIARAIALRPPLVVADEPVSALDVSIQAQVINLLRDLQTELGLSYLFISHDLAVVRQMADEVAVMYLGRIVERGPAETVLQKAAHPYTRALREAVLTPGPQAALRIKPIAGESVSAVHRPTGCAFRARCPIATDRCAVERPLLRPIGPTHEVACHFADEG
jgi:oligopeptide/dipeptide ABC transporter ATP-binding protein